MCLVLMLVCRADIRAQSLPRDVVKHIKEATVYVQVEHSSPLTGASAPSSGSGFFISKDG